MSKLTVAVGMSGGVDSSVTAGLLVEQGYNVIGVTMRIWDEGYIKYDNKLPTGHACFGPNEVEDIEDAKNVSKQLNIPFYIVDLRKEFKELVLKYFHREYSNGRTPNPCLKCNRLLKFEALLLGLKNKGVNWDYYATGHYVRLIEKSGKFFLLRGLDKNKDQSYLLYGLNQEKLSKILFPLGELSKKDVRKKAEQLNLKVSDKIESQDFYAGKYTELFKGSDSKKGNIIDNKGNILGKHNGIQYYTIGQRRGLGISSDRPLYVTKIKAENNTITVGIKDELKCQTFFVEDVNWIVNPENIDFNNITVQIRYGHKASLASLKIEGKLIKVDFFEQQLAITPGQAAVFYNGDILLGGGIII